MDSKEHSGGPRSNPQNLETQGENRAYDDENWLK